MSNDYIETTVYPMIPAKCLTDVDAWLLSRVFKTEKKDDRIGFYACRDLCEGFDELLPDNELSKALATSRQVCPELCAAVDRRIKNGGITRGCVDHETIFQTIIRRHAGLLQRIRIDEVAGNTRGIVYDETVTFITANTIESLRANLGEATDCTLVHRRGPHQPESPYFLFLRGHLGCSPAGR
ncbi:MAG: hypothetical protein WAK69_12595 [Rhodoplanes sp.]